MNVERHHYESNKFIHIDKTAHRAHQWTKWIENSFESSMNKMSNCSSNSSTNKTNRKYENIWFLYNRRRFFYEFSRSISFQYYIWYNCFFIINTIIFFYFCSIVSDVFKHFTKSKFTKFIQSHLEIHRIRRCSWSGERSRSSYMEVFGGFYIKGYFHLFSSMGWILNFISIYSINGMNKWSILIIYSFMK